MSKPFFRFIGDIHGVIPTYVRLASEAEYSLQVGDLGFEYAGIEKLDPEKHKVIGGNHDNYTHHGDGVFVNQTKHFLGDFGTWDVPGMLKLFYVRGGRSVDRESRTEGFDWWPEEELRYGKLSEAIAAYIEAKPAIMVSHECPAFLVNEVTRWKVPLKPSTTAYALESMWQAHKPNIWIFGHFHHNWDLTFGGTYFRCLDINSVYDQSTPFSEKEMSIMKMWEDMGAK